MPFDITPLKDCHNCKYGFCVSYIREQSKRMKDRDTQYRLAQKIIMACTFEDGVPGFGSINLSSTPLSELVDKCILNGKLAGKFIENNIPLHYGLNVEEPFHLTSGQIGKVRGDIFETLSRAILWNSSLLYSGVYDGKCNPEIKTFFSSVNPKEISSVNPKERYAAITLGDNYDLKRLFNRDAANEFMAFEEHLKNKGTSFCYSTPDLIVIKCNDKTWPKFSKAINTLSIENQDMISTIRHEIEGDICPSDVILAAGIKTSIRSDRMYQLLFEANAWKAIWREIYSLKPSKYYSLIGQSYGADPIKLKSVDFTSLNSNHDVGKAIDGLVEFSTPQDLIKWYIQSLA